MGAKRDREAKPERDEHVGALRVPALSDLMLGLGNLGPRASHMDRAGVGNSGPGPRYGSGQDEIHLAGGIAETERLERAPV